MLVALVEQQLQTKTDAEVGTLGLDRLAQRRVQAPGAQALGCAREVPDAGKHHAMSPATPS